MAGATVEQTRWRIHGPADFDFAELGSDVAPANSQVPLKSASESLRSIGDLVDHFAEHLAGSHTVNTSAGWNELDLSGNVTKPSVTAAQLLATVVWIAIFGSVAALMRRAAFRQSVVAHPQTLLVLAGVMWWLLLAPSALGLFIALVASAAPLAPVWRIKRARRPQLIRLPAQVLRDAPA
jgi:hypothetical protein